MVRQSALASVRRLVLIVLFRLRGVPCCAAAIEAYDRIHMGTASPYGLENSDDRLTSEWSHRELGPRSGGGLQRLVHIVGIGLCAGCSTSGAVVVHRASGVEVRAAS